MGREMIKATLQKNPFNLGDGRTVLQFEPGVTVGYCVEQLTSGKLRDGLKLITVVNGKVVPDSEVMKAGQMLAVYAQPTGGGGQQGNTGPKNMVIGAVLIAAAVVTQQYYNIPMITQFMFAAGASLAIGGFVNTVFPAKGTDLQNMNQMDELERSNSYAFGPQRNGVEEGGVLPVLYGTARVVPYIIQNYIIASFPSDTLYIQYAVCEGPISSINTTPSDNDNLQINGTEWNLIEGVQAPDYRYGTGSQTVMTGAQDIREDVAVSQEVTYASPVVVTTSGTEFNKIAIALMFPEGIWHLDDTGHPENYTLRVKIEYKRPAGSYVYLPPADTTIDIWNDAQQRYEFTSNKQETMRFYLQHTLESLDDTVDLRISFTEAPQTDIRRYGSRLFFSYFTEITNQLLTYPFTALIAVEIRGSSKINGQVPLVTCVASKGTVDVHNGSGWVTKNSNIPAWAVYDMLVNDSYGAGVPYTQVDYNSFNTWAGYTEGLSPALQVNGIFDQAFSVAEAIQKVGEFGRGAVVQRGSTYFVIIDKETSVSQIFNVGNIVAGSFNLAYLPADQRANVVEVTYFDATDDYTRTIREVKADGFDDASTIINRSTVFLPFCTSETLALKHAKYLLNNNTIIRRTVEFEADIDSIAVTAGDVIGVQHDVIANAYGGRVVSVSVNDVTIDKDVTMVSGTDYGFTVREGNNSNNLRTETITGSNTTTDTLSISDASDIVEGDVWVFNEVNTQYAEYRVRTIERGQDLKAKIIAVQYDDAIYSDTVAQESPATPTLLAAVVGLNLTEVWKVDEAGIGRSVLNVTWRGVSISWDVIVSGTDAVDTGDLIQTVREQKAFVWGLQVDKQYTVRVQSSERPNQYEEATITIDGKPEVPNDVTGFLASIVLNGVQLTWTNVIDWDLGGYDIYINGATFAYGIKATTYFINDEDVPLGTVTFGIKARDIFSQESATLITSALLIQAPAAPTITQVFQGEDMLITWSDARRTFTIDKYVVNDSLILLGREYRQRITSTGNQAFSVYATDRANNTGSTSSLTVVVSNPGAISNLTTVSADNNLRLYWDAPTVTSLPIAKYEIRKGATFSSATSLGFSDGTFKGQTEASGGTYTYWVAPVDTAGNYGPETSIQATLLDPPDFVLVDSFVTETLDSNANVFVDHEGRQYAAVDTTVTYEDVFINNSAADWGDLAALFDYYGEAICIQDDLDVEFSSQWDLGADVTNVILKAAITREQFVGTSAEFQLQAEVYDQADVLQETILGTPDINKFTALIGKVTFSILDAATSTNFLIRIQDVTASVSVKEITEAGYGTITNAGTGLTVNLTKPFLDIQSVIASAYANAYYCETSWDSSVPSITVIMYNAAGTAVTGDFSFIARGVM